MHFRICFLQSICFLFKFNLFLTSILASVSYAQYRRPTDVHNFAAEILKVLTQCPAPQSVVQ